MAGGNNYNSLIFYGELYAFGLYSLTDTFTLGCDREKLKNVL